LQLLWGRASDVSSDVLLPAVGRYVVPADSSPTALVANLDKAGIAAVKKIVTLS